MAKGKSSSGTKYVSKGLVGTNRKISNQLRSERNEADNMINKFKAFLAGSNPWITIDNPNPNETKARRIKVRMRDIHGDPKEYLYGRQDKKKKAA